MGGWVWVGVGGCECMWVCAHGNQTRFLWKFSLTTTTSSTKATQLITIYCWHSRSKHWRKKKIPTRNGKISKWPIPGLFYLYFRLFNTVLMQLILNKICQWLDSNRGSLWCWKPPIFQFCAVILVSAEDLSSSSANLKQNNFLWILNKWLKRINWIKNDFIFCHFSNKQKSIEINWSS